ncbi:hypothetical protein PIB30_066115 [Stylosanthes scabra]|uniref:Transposase (putative) gypsy type domain-containing protein n=2 Tax=Stylosanthes scabra TaxID=79078 RepID=A0ABU6UNW8_9FABA|nr:hypothetical protein [Stylosanthes scabra]
MLQVSCRRKVDRSGSLFQKLLRVVVLKLRGQSDLMADVSILENTFALLLLIISQVFLEMAENQPENQEAVVPAAGVVQIPRELPFIYRWVANDVLGTPSSLDQQYLDELKLTGVLFGGRDLERRYRVEAARRGERVCFMNLDHSTVPHWLWVNEVMFTEFGVRIPFSDFQQRLLNRASVAPSQLHPNSWSSIRCFELVTEFLELPQDPKVFLYLFKLYSSNTSGKTKKVYMSIRPGNHRKIFALYEDSFHDFKGRYFKIFSVGNHRPFWLSLEGDGRFPPYWSDQAVEMAGNDVTLARLRRLIRPAPAKSLPSPSTAVPPGGARSVPAESVGKTQAEPEGGSSTNVGRENVGEQHVEISSPIEEEIPLPPPPFTEETTFRSRGFKWPEEVPNVGGWV